MLTDDQLLNLCDKVHGLEDVSDRACLEYARHVIDALRAQADAEPLFYYRPCGEDGLYEGPVHANSVSGKMLRAAKREEWNGCSQSSQCVISACHSIYGSAASGYAETSGRIDRLLSPAAGRAGGG